MPTNPTRTIDIIGTGIIDIGTERERTNREAALGQKRQSSER